MADDSVQNDEHLYRRVPNIPSMFSTVNGKLQLSSSAFNDPGSNGSQKRPSVDRAKLRNFDPAQSKTAPTQGIVGLVAGEVRAIRDVKKTDPSGTTIYTHDVDVVPEPLPENESHAVVTVSPQFASRRPFDRLKDSLARLAEQKGWLVPPSDP
ncbi:hypothetical protein ISI01_26155 [Burkholderia pseudomallei]|uniref:hypothetical protein n=1 Tax=Burkholderia pseudomallei TaxID=28450 RepID=UPI0011786BE1|nr:hypothetical protein [Burkholderia pseudomallei]MBF3898958.1 hypothetical protein [Burkholderia pseudomallei]MBF4021232.1 hypothetical protein [Burkholderia pseudomallei]